MGKTVESENQRLS